MKSFRHINAKTVEEACSLLRDHGGSAVLNAGGTDLLSTLKGDFLFSYPEAVINIKTIRDLDYIVETEKDIKIGALARLRDVAGSSLLKENCAALVEAAHSVATPQIRNMATIGGNLCQDIRCWYYRYPRSLGGPIQCLRKGKGPCLAVRGDNRYHAVMGAKKCFAVCPSDTAVALVALGAILTIAGPEGQRRIAITDLFNNLGLSIGKHEMVTEIRIPKTPLPDKQAFLKFTLRKPVDFAVVSVASVINISDGVCTDIRLVLGAVAPAPVRAQGAEDVLKGKQINEAAVEEAAERAMAEARPLKMNGYKIDIAKTLIKTALVER